MYTAHTRAHTRTQQHTIDVKLKALHEVRGRTKCIKDNGDDEKESNTVIKLSNVDSGERRC